MFWRVLKKDMLHKKTMNVILFLFIVMATMLFGSSVKNLKCILNSIDYFGKMTHASDYVQLCFKPELLKKALDECNEVSDYTINELLPISDNKMYTKDQMIDNAGTLMMGKVSKEYNLILDQNNQPIYKINPGEIAISNYCSEKYDIQVGDSIRFTVGNDEREFRVAVIDKDMFFGSASVGSMRLMVSDEDFKELYRRNSDIAFYMASIKTEDTNAVRKSIANVKADSIVGFDYTTLCSVFLMDQMIMAITILASIILIVIALVMLRYTILFTMQEEYKSIGVMKAIGLKKSSIRKIYLAKYTVLSVTGAFIGGILSVPFANLMIHSVEKNIAIEKDNSILWIHGASGVLIILLVVGYCYLCTGKLGKITAMQAIRYGESGERFAKKSPVSLHKMKKMSVKRYLAWNDILSSPKRYLSMMISFALGIVLIILVDNSATTLGEKTMARVMEFETCDVAVNDGQSTELTGKTQTEINDAMQKQEAVYRNEGIPIHMFTTDVIQTTAYSEKKPQGITLNTYFMLGIGESTYTYLKGSAPILDNECAVTQRALEQLGLKIGDSVKLKADGKESSYLITASYENALYQGLGIEVTSQSEISKAKVCQVGIFQGRFDRGDANQWIEKMKEITPTYKIYTCEEYLRENLGNTIDTLNQVKMFLLFLAITINLLVTVLMEKTIFTKDRSELALLLSLGVKVKTLRQYQTIRIVLVTVAAMILGAVLSLLCERPCVALTFGSMGTKSIRLVREPLRVYLLYPLVITIITSIAAYLSTGEMKKIQFSEINNIE